MDKISFVSTVNASAFVLNEMKNNKMILSFGFRAQVLYSYAMKFTMNIHKCNLHLLDSTYAFILLIYISSSAMQLEVIILVKTKIP